MPDQLPYSHEDLKRYVQQQMSPKEMHDFEKVLLNDLFLSDALDGYMKADLPMADTHLAEIKEELAQQKSDSKVIAMPAAKTSWWRVAAIVFVVVSAGVISYSVMQQPAVQEHANANVPVIQQPKSLPANDSIKATGQAAVSGNGAIQEDTKAKDNVSLAASQSKPLEAAKAYNRDTASAETAIESDVSKPTAGAPYSEIKQANDDNLATKKELPALARQTAPAAKEFKGQVINQSGEPVPYASIKMSGVPSAVSADKDGKFSLKTSADTIAKVDVNAVGYASANAKLKTNEAENKIMLQESNQSLNEVVVVSGLATRKKLAEKGAVISTKDIVVAEPVIGWSNYNQYLKKAADSTLVADGKKPVNTVVEVSFTINKKGKPEHLKTTSTAERYFTKKAKQIVENGPLWKAADAGKDARVVVRF